MSCLGYLVDLGQEICRTRDLSVIPWPHAISGFALAGSFLPLPAFKLDNALIEFSMRFVLGDLTQETRIGPYHISWPYPGAATRQ